MSRERDYWQSLSNAWEESGQSQRKFCEQKEIGFSRFTQWRSMLRSEERADSINSSQENSSSKLFNPISFPQPHSVSKPNTIDSHIEIQLPLGITMRIPVDVSQ